MIIRSGRMAHKHYKKGMICPYCGEKFSWGERLWKSPWDLIKCSYCAGVCCSPRKWIILQIFIIFCGGGLIVLRMPTDLNLNHWRGRALRPIIPFILLGILCNLLGCCFVPLQKAE